MNHAARVALPSHIHILVYEHMKYTKQADGHYTEERKLDSMVCYSDEQLDDVIPGLNYCPTLDVYAVRGCEPGVFEFYIVTLDSATHHASA